MCEKEPSRRLGLHEIFAHPWMAGPVYSPTELQGAMRPRLEKLGKTEHPCRAKGSPRSEPQPATSSQKAARAEPAHSGCAVECAEIRRRVELRTMLHPKVDVRAEPKPDSTASTEDKTVPLSTDAAATVPKLEEEVPHHRGNIWAFCYANGSPLFIIGPDCTAFPMSTMGRDVLRGTERVPGAAELRLNLFPHLESDSGRNHPRILAVRHPVLQLSSHLHRESGRRLPEEGPDNSTRKTVCIRLCDNRRRELYCKVCKLVRVPNTKTTHCMECDVCVEGSAVCHMGE